MNLRPDPTFHVSPKLAMEAPVENYAFTVMLSPDGSQSDGIAVIDLKPGLTPTAKLYTKVIVPNRLTGLPLWLNACSSSLSPLSATHSLNERRYLIAGHSVIAHLHIIDVKEPLKAHIHKTIEPEDCSARLDIRACTQSTADQKVSTCPVAVAQQNGTDLAPVSCG
jgi:selenium-binding protein 1